MRSAEKSKISHAVLVKRSRQNKALRIIKLLSRNMDLSKATVLDIGTGSGDIAHKFAKVCKEVVSVDLYDERVEKKGYIFKPVHDESLPFKGDTFDVVISNHVIEHVPNQELHLSEALRVLKTGGRLYLATPNKIWLTDPHYKLPFISWLPRGISDKYLKTFKGKILRWDIYPITHWGIKKELVNVEVINAVPAIIKMNNLDEKKVPRVVGSILRYFPERLLAPLQYISPTLVYVVIKK